MGIRSFQGKAGRLNHFIFIDFFRNAEKNDENPAGGNIIPPKNDNRMSHLLSLWQSYYFRTITFLIINILGNGWISAGRNYQESSEWSFKWGI